MTEEQIRQARTIMVRPDLMRHGYHGAPTAISMDAIIGKDVVLSPFVNIYGCVIGDGTKVGAYVEIAEGVVIGKRCKIAPGALMGPGLRIGNDCYIGPNVIFANVKHPTAGRPDIEGTLVQDDVNIGAGCIILPNITLGKGCEIGAGTVVAWNVQPHERIRHELKYHREWINR